MFDQSMEVLQMEVHTMDHNLLTDIQDLPHILLLLQILIVELVCILQ